LIPKDESSTAAVSVPEKCWSPDLDAHQLLEDDQLLKEFDRFTTYSKLVADTPLEPVALPPPVEDLTQLQQLFGYTREDVRHGPGSHGQRRDKDAVWSMGDDTPLAPLAHAPRPVYAFFRQRFAQVTNPAIDPRCANPVRH